MDARISRELPFTERVEMWLNFEAFNVFNHVSDTGREHAGIQRCKRRADSDRELGTGNRHRASRTARTLAVRRSAFASFSKYVF